MTVNPFAGILGLEDLEDEAKSISAQAVQKTDIPKGTIVFSSGAECENYLLVTDGSVRVQMVSENGREIVLYRVESGQTCIMTTTCLMSNNVYSAQAITETDITALILPASAFHHLVNASAVFRAFVFSSYGTRLADLLMLVDEVAFHRIDVRLAKFLVDRQNNAGQLPTTHQDLATELGSAREVISRQLKEFEKRGWIQMSRGNIEILKSKDLLSLCD